MELEPYRGELVGGPSDDPGAPLTPVLDIPWLPPFPDARSDIGMRSDMRLALVAAMRFLPPRQRAVLVLREVLQFSDMRGTGWVMKQLTANGQPALAAYAPDPVAA